ncbi:MULTISPECIES: hypothetical protein [Shouchella]|uniref:Uncharacterized protein n=2 Tax=Shouchella TaxID=2893057 RepID=A0ABY7WGB3_9BACI|nr:MULTISPECIES: hypothetical protein [Shouchella]MED4129158.1 hypothetical protein [Shouchella miscanthi]WDF05700.1 hypothetical protein PQ477_09785 [Shouchella hunanensis]GAF20564.1 hypothetical protein JCM19047_208 [Bacillus sp. JCM 19047]
MKTRLLYKLDDNKNTSLKIIESDHQLFVPNEKDVLLLDGWGYVIGSRELSYKDDLLEITILCYRESKKRMK